MLFVRGGVQSDDRLISIDVVDYELGCSGCSIEYGWTGMKRLRFFLTVVVQQMNTLAAEPKQ